jgi:hypothetical protein
MQKGVKFYTCVFAFTLFTFTRDLNRPYVYLTVGLL